MTDKTDNETIQKLADTLGIITLVSGETASGARFWAYLSVPPSKYDEFLAVQERGDYNLTDWGDILRYGEGESPSPDIMAEMEEDYGINHQLEGMVKDLYQSLLGDDEEQ